MFKACLDCIAGYDLIRNQRQNEDSYGTQLNGETHIAPPWPARHSQSNKMYLLPTTLNIQDIVRVMGTLNSNRRVLKVSLITGHNSPDYNNIACEFEANFPSESSNKNNIILKIVQNGNQEIIPQMDSYASTNFMPDANFNISFCPRGGSLDINIEESFFENVPLKHNIEDVRFIQVSGDVEKVQKLEFIFAK